MTRARSFRLWLLTMAAFLFTTCLCSTFAASAEPMFTVLGDEFLSAWLYPYGLSADGSVVVGQVATLASGVEAFRWTSEGGMVGLGNLPRRFGRGSSKAVAISADGSVVVGESDSDGRRREAFRWTSDGGMVGLGVLVPDEPRVGSWATATSADGSVVVGEGLGPAGYEAFRWTVDGGMVGLGSVPGGFSKSHAIGVSADGSVVVGGSGSALGYEAFRWTAEGGMEGLGFLPGGSSISWATAISADGSVVVGEAGSEAFRWTSEGGMVGLGYGPRGHDVEPFAISADGSVVVGSGYHSDLRYEAMIWDSTNGWQELHQVLTDLGLDLKDWRLFDARAISADGLTIVGLGAPPGGFADGWMAVLPSIKVIGIDIKPGNDLNPINPYSRGVIPVAILGSDDFDVADVDVTTLAFGPEGAPILYRRDEHFRDTNGDGFTDVVSHYRTQETGIAQGDVEACISGMTFDGINFRGCDSIRTFPACGSGFELALLLPGLMWLRKRRRVH